jgi:CubicO group peptidase (beta-lactamase class C family)
MKNNRHLAVLPNAVLACALLGPTASHALNVISLIKSMPAGTGYSAWDLCSRSIEAGEDFAYVKAHYTAPKVPPLPIFWAISPASNKVSVSAALLTPRSAIYRPGLGCTLITPDVSEASVRAQAFTPVATTAPNSSPWPAGEGMAQSSLLSPAWKATLDASATKLFAETTSDPTKKVNTTALLVAQDGQLVYEKYADRVARNRVQLGWSMTKTLTSLIAGVMEKDGKLQLDQAVGLSEWASTPKAAITWRQLLNMAPGIQWDEGQYAGADDTTQMLFSQPDMCAWAATQPMAVKPGTVFNYSTGFSNLAMCGLKRLAGGTHQSIYNYYQSRLFAPLGIRGGVIEPDAAGTPVGGARGMLRPVDWLRLGQLVASNGQWQGQAILTPQYVSFMKAASPASPEYGGSMWRQPSHHVPPDLRARLPDDMVFFAGFQEQLMVIVPSRKLVLLRMGVSFDTELARRQVFQLVADLLSKS